MKNCKSCGAQMEDNQRFCLNCGAENQPIQSNVNQYNPSLQPQNVNNGNPSFNSNTSDGVNGYQNTIPQSPVPPKKKNLSAGAKIGDNYVSITVTGKDKANTDKLFNMFY